MTTGHDESHDKSMFTVNVQCCVTGFCSRGVNSVHAIIHASCGELVKQTARLAGYSKLNDGDMPKSTVRRVKITVVPGYASLGTDSVGRGIKDSGVDRDHGTRLDIEFRLNVAGGARV
jgi:hypothetical protein